MQAEFRQVIYVSERTDLSDDSLTNIFDTSQNNNPEKGITGCLLIGSNSIFNLGAQAWRWRSCIQELNRYQAQKCKNSTTKVLKKIVFIMGNEFL